MKKILGILAGVALVVASVGVGAQEKYPNQPVRLIVPFPPGGGTDLVSRVIATELSKSTGWAVAPDNKPGSGGSLGLGLGGKAKPDGYTLVMAQNANLVVNPLLGVGNYDPIKDFSPVLLVASAPQVLIVAKDSKFKTIQELIEAAKSKPGSVKFASPGVGTSAHLAGELMQQLSGAKFLHVPYKGTGQALPDLFGGRVDFFIASAPSLMTHIKEGTGRALAVFDKKRSADLPDIPTLVEVGYPNSEAVTWWGVVAPAGTPKAVIERLNKEINAILKLPETISQLKNGGADAHGSSVEAFSALIKSDVPKWQSVIEKANLKPRG